MKEKKKTEKGLVTKKHHRVKHQRKSPRFEISVRLVQNVQLINLSETCNKSNKYVTDERENFGYG